jgi:hypothetical protein
MEVRAMPKITAATKNRLNSRGLMYIKAFAHNLFHKICEEHLRPVLRLLPAPVPSQDTA